MEDREVARQDKSEEKEEHEKHYVSRETGEASPTMEEIVLAHSKKIKQLAREREALLTNVNVTQ